MANTISAELERPVDRVREHTAFVVNRRIDRNTRASIDETLGGGRDAIVARLVELDHEWDIDRALMVNFAVVGGASFATGIAQYANRRSKGMLYFFGTQLGFLLLHGLAGWCPPASVFRRLGFRTKSEIETERRVLLRALETESARP